MTGIYEQWNNHEDQHVDPEHREATVVPGLIMKAHNLPEFLHEPVSQVWDAAMRCAVEYAEAVALVLGELGQQR